MNRNLRKLFLIMQLLGGTGFIYFLAERNSHVILWLLFFIFIIYTANTIPRILLGSREERLLRYFGRKPNVRLQLVKDIASKVGVSQESIEPLEMVVVYCLFLARHGVSEVINLINKLSNDEWVIHRSEDFFTQIMSVSQEFRTIGLHQDHKEIIQFGETVASHYNRMEWAETFRLKREEILQRQKDDAPLIRYRRR